MKRNGKIDIIPKCKGMVKLKVKAMAIKIKSKSKGMVQYK